MPDIREEFEASGLTVHFERDPWNTDRYDSAWTQAAWIGWQASRAALKVELPDGDPGEVGPRKFVIEEVKEALQQAGIEVVK